MYQVLGLCKIANTEPEQQYELILKDLENKSPGYVQTTEYGTEAQVRAMLKNGGMTETRINIYSERASCLA